MWTNASVTITRRGEGFDDDTGYRTDESADADEVLTDVRCCLSQSTGNRRAVYSEGQREFTKPVYMLMIPGEADADIRPGDQATVMPDNGTEMTYTVSDATFTAGIAEAHWECAVERILQSA